jgi:hypothetical protein
MYIQEPHLLFSHIRLDTAGVSLMNLEKKGFESEKTSRTNLEDFLFTIKLSAETACYALHLFFYSPFDFNVPF